MTLPELHVYIKKLAKFKAAGQPYSIDLSNGTVHTEACDYEVTMPEAVARDITLEEV